MELSLIYFTYFLFILLSIADQTELNNPCSTSRRLLFFGGFSFPLGEKKSEHISSSSSSKSSSPPSSPPKYSRTDAAHGLTVYIRPQTSNELGHKVRSYSHLLKSKLYTKEERAILKKSQAEKKKQQQQQQPNKSLQKKSPVQQKPSISTKTQELVAVNDEERDRCRALLRIDHQKPVVPPKDVKKTKKEKKSIASKVKNVTSKAKKKVATAAKALPINDKHKSKKEKATKNKATPISTEKKKSVNKPSETQPLTPPPVNEAPIKTAPPPPPPTSQSSANIKSKRERQPVIEQPIERLNIDDVDDLDNDEKNNSVVGRAYHFVKNMFQLSDDILENNRTQEEDQILSSINEEQRHQSRKLLAINHQTKSIIYNDHEFDLHLNELDEQQFDDLSLSVVSISKRHLLSVKTNKHSVPSKSMNIKEKRAISNTNKPKVGWAYRYRISRFLADQNMKRTGRGKKATGGGKAKQEQVNSKQNNKKTSSLINSKFSKRKLLELNNDDKSSWDNDDISSQDIINSVSITEQFVPKRQLLASKPTVQDEEETDSEDEEDIEKSNERRRMKSYDALTDPATIVRSYDRGLFKPRVGWQFRYRVSRYIDSLRENIREDQERLKLGLLAIKRKTPQELSGRRKRVLDKPFQPEQEEIPTIVEDNKPNVGWRYRYRISKMLEAKRRGDYVDDEDEKRKARLDQKKKPSGVVKPNVDDEDCLEWEHDLDPELRKINEEGQRVGWAYRYRIRRKLDELKQKRTETGIPFDLETLGGKRDKKVLTTTTSTTVASEEKAEDPNKKTVGWKYRYRVSKMREAQKLETIEAVTKLASKKHEKIPTDEKLDPVLSRLTPDERVVGWQYRYRIRRKLDSIRNVTRETTEGGKRGKKSKQKDKEKIIKVVEESIEKILNIDDIDETPFMEYFRRSSSYVFFGLVPAARKSICLFPLPVTLPFCNDEDDEDSIETITTTSTPKQISTKKLRTKKEKRAKQFIHSHSTKLDTIDEKIDEPVKPLSKTPIRKVEKPQKKQHQPRILHSTVRRHNNEQVKHFDEEEKPVKKLIGVESKKNKNKKQFQIIGKEVKIKNKHSLTPPTPTITTNPPPILTTTPPPTPSVTTNPPPIRTTTTTHPPIVTTSPPIVEVPKTTPAPPPPPREPEIIVPKTTPPPLRTIAEVIQEEASTLLSTNPTSFSEETKEEVNEANENLAVTSTTTPSIRDDSTTSGEDDDDSSSSDSDSSSSDSDSNEDASNPSPVKKIKQFYENAKESVHDVFDLNDEKDSS